MQEPNLLHDFFLFFLSAKVKKVFAKSNKRL